MEFVNLTTKPPAYYSKPDLDLIYFYQYFVSWFIPLIILLGSFGTILSIVVLKLRHTTQVEIRCWFLTLSSNDLFGLLFGLLGLYLSRLEIITSIPNINFDIKMTNIIFCFTYSNIIYFSLLLSSWLQAGISILRAISTVRPLKSRSQITIKSGRYYLLILVLSALIISIVMINTTMEYSESFVRNQSSGYRCKLKHNYRDVFYFSSLIIRVIIPILLMSLSSIFIWQSLKKHQHERRKSCLSEYEYYKTNNHHVIKTSNSSTSINNIHKRATIKRRINRSNHRNISCMLLCMNLAFIVSNLPFEIIKLLYHNFDLNSIKTRDQLRSYILSRIFDKFLNIIVYLNQSTNWLFYFMLGRKFRMDLLSILKCETRQRRKSYYKNIVLVNSINNRHLDISTNTIANPHFDEGNNALNKKIALSKQSTIEKYIDLKKQ